MKISELEVGEIYACNNRRCRLERAWTDADGVARAMIASGRKFEKSYEISASSYYLKDDIRSLTSTWEKHKEMKQRQKEQRDRANDLSIRFRDVLEDRGMRGWLGADGQMTIHGNLDQFEKLLGELGENSRREAGSALESLFGGEG